ncbi:MAG: sigma-70 family RNA polymerase sigma factor [Xanthomonadales bacterium]|nr:sigma-70 family RNA polymerase sigma factor [Xanthomonadales bacterium]
MISSIDSAPIPTPGPAQAAGDDARDAAWLAATAAGDRRAFERLYLHHHARLSRFIARHTSQRDLVDEVVSEAFLVVWRSASTFRGESKASTWIIGIAWRCLMKALRSQARSSVRNDLEMTEEAVPTGEVDGGEQRELRDWLRGGLALLPVDQRTTIELAYFLGQSCEEIAQIMECAVGTVKARLFHARLRLRNSLPSLAGLAAGGHVAGGVQDR